MLPNPGGLWSQLIDGSCIHFDDPKSCDITLKPKDIARALSHIGRYTGNTKSFYCVAQHSVLVSQLVRFMGGSLEAQLYGLLHDVHEMVLGDISTPVKHFIKTSGDGDLIGNMERSIDRLLFPIMGATWEFSDETYKIVKECDLLALAIEYKCLCKKRYAWNLPPIPAKLRAMKVVPLTPEKSETIFVQRHRELLHQLRVERGRATKRRPSSKSAAYREAMAELRRSGVPG